MILGVGIGRREGFGAIIGREAILAQDIGFLGVAIGVATGVAGGVGVVGGVRTSFGVGTAISLAGFFAW